MQVTLKGNPIDINGTIPEIGANAPAFMLTAQDLSDFSSTDFTSQKVLLNIFPSIDTPVCQASVRAFNQSAANLPNVSVICVSADLPFAHSRFCGAENIENVTSGSTFRHGSFGKDYGLEITSGPLKGLLARAVIVIDENGTVIHSQLVPEIAEEPNYDEALACLT